MKKIIVLIAVFISAVWSLDGELRETTGSTARRSVFSYSEDEIEPLSWKNGRKKHQNWCTEQSSPINIATDKIIFSQFPRQKKGVEDDEKERPETLTILSRVPNVQNLTWVLDKPTEYHGVVIRPKLYASLTLQDYYDPITNTNSFTSFQLQFIGLFYCDISKAPQFRTMHQINKKRFPLELQFVFGRTRDRFEVVTNSAEGTEGFFENKQLVIVSVLGEVGDRKNVLFQPLADATRKFRERISVSGYKFRPLGGIQAPWSPTWLLPAYSGYYYYDRGSYPVKPCWKVARYYVLEDTLKISKEQLDGLTKGNKSSRFRCTHSFKIFKKVGKGQGKSSIKFNSVGMEMAGVDDGAPLDDSHRKERDEKWMKRDLYRSQLHGRNMKVISDGKSNGETVVTEYATVMKVFIAVIWIQMNFWTFTFITL